MLDGRVDGGGGGWWLFSKVITQDVICSQFPLWLSSMAVLQPHTRAQAVGQELNLFASSGFKQVHKLHIYTLIPQFSLTQPSTPKFFTGCVLPGLSHQPLSDCFLLSPAAPARPPRTQQAPL